MYVGPLRPHSRSAKLQTATPTTPTIHSAQGGGVFASVLALFMTAPLQV